MLLREAPTRQLIERREEMLRQVEAINREVSRRAREEFEQHRAERNAWLQKTAESSRLASAMADV